MTTPLAEHRAAVALLAEELAAPRWGRAESWAGAYGHLARMARLAGLVPPPGGPSKAKAAELAAAAREALAGAPLPESPAAEPAAEPTEPPPAGPARRRLRSRGASGEAPAATLPPPPPVDAGEPVGQSGEAPAPAAPLTDPATAPEAPAPAAPVPPAPPAGDWAEERARLLEEVESLRACLATEEQESARLGVALEDAERAREEADQAREEAETTLEEARKEWHDAQDERDEEAAEKTRSELVADIEDVLLSADRRLVEYHGRRLGLELLPMHGKAVA